MGSPAYFGKLVNFAAAARKNALVPFGSFSPQDNLNFIANIPGPVQPTIAPTPLNFSASMVIDTATGAVFTFTAAGNITSMTLNFLGSPTIPDGTRVQLRVTMDPTGGWTVALPTNLVTDTGFAVDPTAGRTTVMPIVWNNANSRWIFSETPFSITGA